MKIVSDTECAYTQTCPGSVFLSGLQNKEKGKDPSWKHLAKYLSVIRLL